MIKQFNEWFLGNTKFDLRPLSFGNRMCPPGYKRDIEISTHYIMHYIASGKGILKKNGVYYPLSAGQIFISKPNEVFGFAADMEDPWHFIWIKFTGDFAKKIDTLPTVLSIDGTAFYNMVNCDPESNTAEEFITAQLYLLFATLFASEKRHDYVTIIKNYVRGRPTIDKITVDEIQQFLNLNRQYMSTMFKKATGMSIQQYIIKERMDRATLLLAQGFSITETAEHIGYVSIYAFSKCFKKTYGISPSEYQKNKSRKE